MNNIKSVKILKNTCNIVFFSAGVRLAIVSGMDLERQQTIKLVTLPYLMGIQVTVNVRTVLCGIKKDAPLLLTQLAMRRV